MGFFSSDEHKISIEDFKKARWHLVSDYGFSEDEAHKLKDIFRSDAYESGSSAGISKRELRHGIEWLKAHPDEHPFSPDQIHKIKKVLGRYL